MSSDIKAHVSLNKHIPIYWNSCNDGYLLNQEESIYYIVSVYSGKSSAYNAAM